MRSWCRKAPNAGQCCLAARGTVLAGGLTLTSLGLVTLMPHRVPRPLPDTAMPLDPWTCTVMKPADSSSSAQQQGSGREWAYAHAWAQGEAYKPRVDSINEHTTNRWLPSPAACWQRRWVAAAQSQLVSELPLGLMGPRAGSCTELGDAQCTGS